MEYETKISSINSILYIFSSHYKLFACNGEIDIHDIYWPWNFLGLALEKFMVSRLKRIETNKVRMDLKLYVLSTGILIRHFNWLFTFDLLSTAFTFSWSSNEKDLNILKVKMLFANWNVSSLFHGDEKYHYLQYKYLVLKS